MKSNIDNLLLFLSENIERLMEVAIDRKKFWYWESYHERENQIKDKIEKRKIYSQIYHLERFGYVNKDGFTLKAINKLAKINKKIETGSKKWDKKWRIVIFDIPEKRKAIRNYLRSNLVELNFKKLQNSVWISPYDNFKEIQEFIKNHSIAQYIVLMVVEKISNDLLFKKKFNLQ